MTRWCVLVLLGILLGGALSASPPPAAAGITQNDLTICKKALQQLVPELKAKFDGYTLWCPTNDAFENFAYLLGYDTEEPASDWLAGAADHQALFRTIMSFHVTKGVAPSTSLRNGPVKTLSGALFKITREGPDVELHTPYVDLDVEDVDMDHSDWVEAPDLTFDGPWRRGRPYVVHAVDRVRIPLSVAATARKARVDIERKLDAMLPQ